jgi:hypothetical protein
MMVTNMKATGDTIGGKGKGNIGGLMVAFMKATGKMMSERDEELIGWVAMSMKGDERTV